MKVVPPITITDARLTSTTALETAPAAYNGATTYAAGDQVSVTTGHTSLVYVSLQASNTGHTPASSATWWRLVTTLYAAWAGGTTYALGDIIMVVGTDSHRLYQSLQASNTGHTPVSTYNGDPADTWWNYVGQTNKTKMFDPTRNARTISKSPLTVVLTPGTRFDTLGVYDATGDTLSVSVTSVLGGGTVFTDSVDLRARHTAGWYAYFFGAFPTSAPCWFPNIPPYSDAIITITVTNASDNAECGPIGLGLAQDLGDAELSPKSDTLNFSTVERDSSGNAILSAVRNVPLTNITCWTDKALVESIRQTRDALDATPAFWSALDDDTDGYFGALFVLGVYRRFLIDMGYTQKAEVTVEIEGI